VPVPVVPVPVVPVPVVPVPVVTVPLVAVPVVPVPEPVVPVPPVPLPVPLVPVPLVPPPGLPPLGFALVVPPRVPSPPRLPTPIVVPPVPPVVPVPPVPVVPVPPLPVVPPVPVVPVPPVPVVPVPLVPVVPPFVVPDPAVPVPFVGWGWPLVPSPVFCKWLTGLKPLLPLPELRIVIEPAFFEVEVELAWWCDVPCAALLAWVDPFFVCPLGPRARMGVEADVRLITVMRRSGGLERRTTGLLLGVGGCGSRDLRVALTRPPVMRNPRSICRKEMKKS
jgi:hypothetical protein